MGGSYPAPPQLINASAFRPTGLPIDVRHYVVASEYAGGIESSGMNVPAIRARDFVFTSRSDAVGGAEDGGDRRRGEIATASCAREFRQAESFRSRLRNPSPIPGQCPRVNPMSFLDRPRFRR